MKPKQKAHWTEKLKKEYEKYLEEQRKKHL